MTANSSDKQLNTQPLKNNRHERFCLALFKGMSQKDAAIEAGYSPKWARSAASRLSTNVNILGRIRQLQEMAKSDAVMTVTERKERLTELAGEDNTSQFGYARGPNIQAIAELNKMEHIYEPEGGVNIDNRTVNINVTSEKAKKLTQRIIEGEKTGGANDN